jgi:hypothetical protein
MESWKSGFFEKGREGIDGFESEAAEMAFRISSY